MTKKLNREWLSHLNDSVTQSASITGVSLYTIALEGWRRGLKLEFYSEATRGEKKRIKYTLGNQDRKYYFNDSSGDLNTNKAIEICGDKGLTQQYLQQNNVPVPKGKEFNTHHSIDEMLEYAKELTFPLVVKPVDGFGGTGVIVDIKNERELKRAITHVQNKLGFARILIQEFVEGDEVRIYVLNNKVIAAANRIPAHIIGDGKQTIASLIKIKNEERAVNPNLRHRLIRTDSELNQYLEERGYSLDTILKENEYLSLRDISNVSLGGEPVDYTDLLTDEQKKIAENATKAVPGLMQCGVDMMINHKFNRAVIIELNASPGIGTHLFPVKGKAKDVPRHIIDFYFPETKSYSMPKQLFYFDLDRIIDPLLTGALSKVEVPEYPSSSTITKQYIVSTNKFEMDICKTLYEAAIKLKLHGYIDKIGENDANSIEIVVNHKDNQNIKKFEELLMSLNEDGNFIKIEIKDYSKPIKLGFELKKAFNSIAELEFKHRQVYREYRTIKIEVERLKKRLKMLKKSKFWKMTVPIRKIESFFKRR